MLQKNQRLIKTTESSRQLISATNFLNKLEQFTSLGLSFLGKKKKKKI